jgi:hypothetical protein
MHIQLTSPRSVCLLLGFSAMTLSAKSLTAFFTPAGIGLL